AHPGGVVGAVNGKLHLQAAAGCRLEHPTLQDPGAVPPTGGLRMVGKREDDAWGARDGLLDLFPKHAPQRVLHEIALEPGCRVLRIIGLLRCRWLRYVPAHNSPCTRCGPNGLTAAFGWRFCSG